MDIIASRIDIEIRDKKGFQNVVVDHLSRLTVNVHDDLLPITESFHVDHLFSVSQFAMVC